MKYTYICKFYPIKLMHTCAYNNMETRFRFNKFVLILEKCMLFQLASINAFPFCTIIRAVTFYLPILLYVLKWSVFLVTLRWRRGRGWVGEEEGLIRLLVLYWINISIHYHNFVTYQPVRLLTLWKRAN